MSPWKVSCNGEEISYNIELSADRRQTETRTDGALPGSNLLGQQNVGTLGLCISMHLVIPPAVCVVHVCQVNALPVIICRMCFACHHNHSGFSLLHRTAALSAMRALSKSMVCLQNAVHMLPQLLWFQSSAPHSGIVSNAGLE